MREMILGVGNQSSLASVIDILESELSSTHGSPRKIVARSTGIELQAARNSFEGPFDSFHLRLHVKGPLRTSLVELVQDGSTQCTVADDDSVFDVTCLSSPDQPDASLKLIDGISELIAVPEVWRFHGDQYRHDTLRPQTLFEAMIRFRASDVHLYPGSDPVFRVDNAIRHTEQHHPLSAEQILSFVKEMAPARDWKLFEDESQCSFRYHELGQGYARVSAFIRRGVPHCTLRFLPETIPSFEELHIPAETMQGLGKLHFGLVLVTGMTGSGKSTTVASLIDWINKNQARHILTIEDPIEYAQINKKSMISQRQLGEDVATFNGAVRAALRQDPDIIFVGEMRDADTIRSAISAASTGHLVISTLHANTASEVITRIVSFFDPVERDLVRLQLRDCARCIICQRLVPRVKGGRIPALEFLFNDTKHISDCILSGDAEGIRAGMQQTLSQSFIVEKYLLDLARDEQISHEQAVAHAASHDVFEQMWHGNYAPPSLDTMKH